MKIVVTGSLGHTGKPLTKELVKKSHEVTVLSHSIESKKEIESLNATAAIGSIDDITFLAEAFKGADAIYTMIPPNFQEGNSNEYYKRIAQNLKSAITKAEVNRVVFLSSWDAHSDSGTGTIVGLYHAEQILNSLHNISITHLRACSMYYNLYNFMDMIKYEGIIGTNIQGEDKYLVYMISTINIQG